MLFFLYLNSFDLKLYYCGIILYLDNSIYLLPCYIIRDNHDKTVRKYKDHIIPVKQSYCFTEGKQKEYLCI